MAKPKPERVDLDIAKQALADEGTVQNAWSRYIILHFRATGKLAPGCDMRDFVAALEKEGGARKMDYTLLCGDATQVLKTLPSNSVHVCVTSPP